MNILEQVARILVVLTAAACCTSPAASQGKSRSFTFWLLVHAAGVWTIELISKNGKFRKETWFRHRWLACMCSVLGSIEKKKKLFLRF